MSQQPCSFFQVADGRYCALPAGHDGPHRFTEPRGTVQFHLTVKFDAEKLARLSRPQLLALFDGLARCLAVGVAKS